MKKITAFLLAVWMLCQISGLNPWMMEQASASGIDSDLNVAISVTEQNGLELKSYLIKRGVPFPEGSVSADDAFVLQCGDEQIPVQTKPLERYEDGSVKWLLTAFAVDLSANETKELILKKGESPSDEHSVITAQNGQTVSLSNGILSLEVSGFGINKLQYGDCDVLQGNGMSVWAMQGGRYPQKSGSVEIIDEGPVYTTVKIKGTIATLNIETEQTITLVRGQNSLLNDVRFIARGGNMTISTVGEEYNLRDSFSESFFEPTALISGDYNPLISCGYMGAYSDRENLTFAVVSNDVEKFRGAVSAETSNGFVWDKWDKRIEFAPIQYNAPYNWLDGLTRTEHSMVSVCSGKKTDFKAELLQSRNTPKVVIDPEQFVKAGIIQSTHTTALQKSQIGAIVASKDQRYGRFDAGSVPFTIDIDENKYTNFNVRPGETEYNLWYASILADDGEFFDIVNESTESWADINIYRGNDSFAYGATRFRNAFDYSQFFSSHPYYGDLSGLYMGYVMTGNEYYKDAIKLAGDFYVKNAKTNISCGYEVATNLNWINSPNISRSKGTEIRFIISARGMLYAYKLFGNEEYKKVADSYCQWAEKIQQKGGWFWQSVTPDGQPYYDNSRGYNSKTSNYVQLYGMRGVCEYYKQTKDKDVLNMLTKFADYLISEMQENGGWMFDPVGDVEISEVNGDGARGEAPMQEIMSAEVFETVYSAVSDEKYLSAMLSMVRYFTAAVQKSGLAPQRYNLPGYADGKINNVISAQNLTYARITPDVAKIIEDNRAAVERLGYSDMAQIFLDNAADISSEIENPFKPIEVTVNAYRSGADEHIYIVNHSGKLSGEWEKQLSLPVSSGGTVYSGLQNEITPTRTKLVGTLKQFDLYMAKKLPIRVNSQASAVTIDTVEYSKDKIILNVTSDSGFGLEISDGDFRVADSLKYNVAIKRSGNTARIEITQDESGAYLASGEKISVSVPDGDTASAFTDIYGHWAANDIMAVQGLGIINGTSETTFEPNRPIKTSEFLAMLLRSIGESDTMERAAELGLTDENYLPDSYISREQMANSTLKLLAQKKELRFQGIEEKKLLLPAAYASEADAVKAEAENLQISENSQIYKNLTLPTKGIFGCDITWKSSDESVITHEGKITRPKAKEPNKKATLTAICTKGNSTAERSFELEVQNESYVYQKSGSNYLSSTIPLNESDQSILKFDLEVQANTDQANTLVGHIDKGKNKVSGTTHSLVPIIIRFNGDGVIDTYDTDKYSAQNKLEYQKGDRFLFHVKIDLEKKTYSVSAVKNGGEECVLAENYGFRKSAETPDKIDAVTLVGDVNDELTLIRHSQIKAVSGEAETEKMPESKYTVSDVKLDRELSGKLLTWYSSDRDLVDENGKILMFPKEKDQEVSLLGTYESFEDAEQIDERYLPAVIKSNAIALMVGDQNRFNPKSDATRAQAAVMIRRLIEIFN